MKGVTVQSQRALFDVALFVFCCCRIVRYLCEQDADKSVADCNGALLDGVPLKCYKMVDKRPK